MQKSTLPQGVKTLKKWYERGSLTFDNPVQRNSGQWSLLQKSLLIHSILSQFPIPNVYLLKTKDESGETIYDCLDAKQRLLSIFEFIDDGYALHSATPEVGVDGTVYDLADMHFEDLSDECKDEILGYRFSVYCLEDTTEQEVEEIFARLNNSTPLSAIQKCRSVMGTDLARWTKEVCQYEFFNKATAFTLAQLRREGDLEVLLQSMMLLDARHEGYQYKAISAKEVTEYCKYIRQEYNRDKREMIEEIMGYLSEAFTEKHKFLKKSNLPMVIVLAKIAIENDIEAGCYKAFVDNFAESVCPQYEENMGSSNTKAVKTQGRLQAIADCFGEYFNIEGINILSIYESEDSEEDENSESVTDEPSADEQTVENA